MLTAFSWCQKARQIRRSLLYFQTEKALPLEPPVKRKKIGTGKSKALADVLLWKKWIFLCGLVGSSEKERTDMKLKNTHMK